MFSNMSRIPRIHDIANLAGVSTATVDRVLNQRSGVRAVTVQRVLQAAAQLDYRTEEGLVSPAPTAPPMRLSFLLPAGNNRFIRMLGDMVNYSQDHWTPFNVRCRTEFIESFNPLELAAA